MRRLLYGRYMRRALTKRFKRFCSRHSRMYYPVDTNRHWVGIVLAVAMQEFELNRAV